MQVGADFIRLASTNGVALRTSRLEEGSTLGRVTCGSRPFIISNSTRQPGIDADIPAEKDISIDKE